MHFDIHAESEPGVEFWVRRDEVEGGVDGDAVLEAAQPHARVPRLRHVLLPVGRGNADTVLKYYLMLMIRCYQCVQMNLPCIQRAMGRR